MIDDNKTMFHPSEPAARNVSPREAQQAAWRGSDTNGLYGLLQHRVNVVRQLIIETLCAEHICPQRSEDDQWIAIRSRQPNDAFSLVSQCAECGQHFAASPTISTLQQAGCGAGR
jgi:hypothetical protein